VLIPLSLHSGTKATHFYEPLSMALCVKNKMDRNCLVADIENAFYKVSLDNGIGLLEAEAIDFCVSDKKRRKARESDIRNSWKSIPDEMIENHSFSLCFMDIAGIRYCMPAYMRFSIKYYETSGSLSIDAPLYALHHNPLLIENSTSRFFTEQQYSVFAKFLRYIVLEAGDEYFDSEIASQAYEAIWSSYDCEFA